MNNRHEVTIYDIARALDLSTSTVSRALNGSASVNKHTRTKIAKTASELGYRRNLFASRLRSQRSQLLGVMVTQLNATISSCVLSGAEAASAEVGYGIVVCQSQNQPDLRVRGLENLQKHSVDGILVTSAYYQEYASHQELAKINLPAVVVEASSFLPSSPRKRITDFQNAYELTTHLVEKGCRNIAYFSANLDTIRRASLLAGYREAIQGRKHSETGNFILTSHEVQESWLDIREVLLSMRPQPDGIIFSNETITAVAVRASDASDSSRSEFWLTCRKGDIASQNQRLVELGKIAASLLICLSERKEDSPSVLNGRGNDFDEV